MCCWFHCRCTRYVTSPLRQSVTDSLAKSLPMAVGACAAMGTMIGTFSYAGNVSIVF